jgi:hypothetical protein
MAGLKDVDFDHVKFISIIRADGGAVMNRLRVKDYESMRIKIRADDMSVKMLAKEESNQLKEFADGIQMNEGECISCNRGANRLKFQKSIACGQCKRDFHELWVCRFLPPRHSYCEDCYLKGLKKSKEGNI